MVRFACAGEKIRKEEPTIFLYVIYKPWNFRRWLGCTKCSMFSSHGVVLLCLVLLLCVSVFFFPYLYCFKQALCIVNI